jgi:hypothetical protein
VDGAYATGSASDNLPNGISTESCTAPHVPQARAIKSPIECASSRQRRGILAYSGSPIKPSMIEHFLKEFDAQRALKTARKLAAHDLSEWAIVGGWAVEIHCILNRQQSSFRQLTDIDFVVPVFDGIPRSLAELFLFRHVHPSDPPAKMLLQFVDPETALRIDVFRAYGRIMSRTFVVEFPIGPMRLAAREDVIARSARLLLDLGIDIPVPEKNARDYIRISEGMPPTNLQVAWEDHRKPEHPCAFLEADQLVRKLISTHDRLLTMPQFSTDTREVCQRCVPNSPFPLADPAEVLSVLGYC